MRPTIRLPLFCCATLLLCLPPFGASQTPIIDFEGLPYSGGCAYGLNPSAPPYPAGGGEPTETPYATVTGGEVRYHGFLWPPFDQTLLYESRAACIGNQQTITIDFKFPVSYVRLIFGMNQDATVTIADDQGYSKQVVYPAGEWGDYQSWVQMPSENVRRVTLTLDDYWDPASRNGAFWVDDITFSSTSSILVIDPFPALLDGSGVVTDGESLATMGAPVSAITAERAGRVVLRVKASFAGERLNLSILNDQGQTSTASGEDGYLGAIATNASPGAGVFQVTATSTSAGPMGLAMYRPPVDFSRSGPDDTASYRSVTLKVESLDTPNATSTFTLRVLRPPVVLVHGLWGSPDDWDVFQPLISDSRFYVRRAVYDYPLAGVITAPVPFYQQWVLAKAKTNALGFAYNAKLVLSNIDLVLSSYRKKYNTAASQVDIVAHSMGGVVTRTLENLPGYRAESYAAGTINKLITIGTPHLGSPIATQIMEDENICPRGIMALMENISLISATVDGSPVNGAMLDLRGDGWGGGLSPVLLELKGATHLPTALIAGEMSSTNLNGLNAWDSPSRAIVAACPGRLANSMTADGWPTIFGQPSDAIVPRASQLANFNSDVTEIASLIHSQGVAKLGFSGPYELEQAGTVPATVINLLNLSSQAAKFHPLY